MLQSQYLPLHYFVEIFSDIRYEYRSVLYVDQSLFFFCIYFSVL